MQIQKEEVKQRILQAAKEEFLTKGFEKASMREIAHKAQITVGNIYAYFHGKEGLLDALLLPSVEQMKRFIFEFSKGEAISELTLGQVTDSLTDIFLENQGQFMLLMNGVDGTKYEHIREQLQAMVTQRIQEELMPNLSLSPPQPLLAAMLSGALLEGILLAFSSYEGREEVLRDQLAQFLSIMFRGFGFVEAQEGENIR